MADITVPPLGDSITEATIARWTKNEGDAIEAGETVVELETDKINVEVPAQKSGVLRKRLKAEGDTVGVDEKLGEIDESADASTASTTKPAEARPADARPADAKPADAKRPSVPAVPPSVSSVVGKTAEPRVAPSAARYAEEHNIPLQGIQGTGRGGVISKPDVMEPPAEGKREPPPAPPATSAPSAPSASQSPRERREKMSTRRKRIAENLMLAAHQTAHLTTFNEIDMSAVIAIRERHKERVEKETGVRLSFMPFFAKASVMALQAYPVVNAQIEGDAILYKQYVNLGIAVASDQGLVVPNVKDAHAMGLVGLGRAIAALAKKARDVKLTMDDLTGGTFTITNGGVFGSLLSTPILNYPQSGILGLHKIEDRPLAVNGEVVVRPMMYVAMTYDHRIIDGREAVLFLVKVKELMEDPAAMLLE